MVRPWHLVLAVHSSRCRLVRTSALYNTSFMRQWGEQEEVVPVAAWFHPSMPVRTKHFLVSLPLLLHVTRSCRCLPLLSWSQWRHPELRTSGRLPHSPYSKVSRYFDTFCSMSCERLINPLHRQEAKTAQAAATYADIWQIKEKAARINGNSLLLNRKTFFFVSLVSCVHWNAG